MEQQHPYFRRLHWQRKVIFFFFYYYIDQVNHYTFPKCVVRSVICQLELSTQITHYVLCEFPCSMFSFPFSPLFLGFNCRRFFLKDMTTAPGHFRQKPAGNWPLLFDHEKDYDDMCAHFMAGTFCEGITNWKWLHHIVFKLPNGINHERDIQDVGCNW